MYYFEEQKEAIDLFKKIAQTAEVMAGYGYIYR